MIPCVVFSGRCATQQGHASDFKGPRSHTEGFHTRRVPGAAYCAQGAPRSEDFIGLVRGVGLSDRHSGLLGAEGDRIGF